MSFAVPSGNFGNVCAGHVARMMGLPIAKLVVATNENDVLDEFFRTGVYRVRGSADTHEMTDGTVYVCAPPVHVKRVSCMKAGVAETTSVRGVSLPAASTAVMA